jgi:hypothetical protein
VRPLPIAFARVFVKMPSGSRMTMAPGGHLGKPASSPHPHERISDSLLTRFHRGFFLPSPEAVPTTASGIFF